MSSMPHIGHIETSPDGQCYRPISVASLRLNTSTDFDLYFKPSPMQPLVLYSERNHQVTDGTFARLAENRITQLYIRDEALRDYTKYLTLNLEDILADSRLPAAEKANLLYTSAQTVLEEVFTRPITRETVEQGREVVHSTVTLMLSKDFAMEHLLRALSTDFYLYTHSMNVTTYSVALAMRAGFRDAPTLREVANGALLHDIGMSRLDPELRTNPGALTPPQWEMVRDHPGKGFRLLEPVGRLGEIALDIVLHHHERMNGNGYPDGLSGAEISPFVRIVGLVNVFDALTSDRMHQPARKTFTAIRFMQNELRNELDPDFLRLFIEIMGLRA